MKVTKTDIGPAPSPHLPPPVRKVKVTEKHDKGADGAARWWLEPDDSIHEHVTTVLATIDNRQATRRTANAKWLRLYSNYAMPVIGGTMQRMSAATYVKNDSLSTLNVIESCVDAAAAKIAKATPKPEIVTSQGSFKQQRKSKLLTKYIAGLINQQNIYEKAQQCFIDCCIWGTGVLKLFIEDGKICAKRVLADDIIVDEEDGRDGDPRQMHQRAHVNRDVLLAQFPDHADKIMSAASQLPGDSYTPVSQELVAVTESWHLPSSDDAGDGKHVICTDNCTLVAEEWTRTWFPFSFLRWKPRPLGFYGSGLAEQLAPTQLEINKICILIQQSIQQVAKPNIFIPVGSNINVQHISAKIGAAIKTSGAMPVPMVPQAQSEEVYNYLHWLIDKCYEMTGISQLSAQSQKPAGLNSGAAIREFQDVETGRFELTGQRYENFFCDMAEKLVALSRELYTDNKGLSVKVPGRKFIEQIDWKDASLDDDQFILQMFPVSSLPSSPAGRMQTVTELVQAGYISKEQSLGLLSFPDLDDYVSTQVAALEDAKMVVDNIRWEGKYESPTPMMNLQACVDLAHSAYLNAKQMDTPQKNLELLIKFFNECQSELDKMNAPPANVNGAPPAPGTPQAKPMAPPTSDILPNAPGAAA